MQSYVSFSFPTASYHHFFQKIRVFLTFVNECVRTQYAFWHKMIKNAVFDGIGERTMFRQKKDKKKRPTERSDGLL